MAPNRSRRPSASSTRQPLPAISETQLAPPRQIPTRSNPRNNPSDTSLSHSPLRAWFESKASTDTRRTAPPAYEWVSRPGEADADADASYLDNGPVEGEKLAAFRRAGGFRRRREWGWWFWGLIALVALLVVGLAVGLGVGLTVGRRKQSGYDVVGGAGSSGNDTFNRTFPLGEYGVVTALRSVDTACTSISSIWRCFPYETYDVSASGSMATFDWTITNTSANFATNRTGTTSDQGIPANLSISATSNVFGITFSNASLTYVSTPGNSSSQRYTFSFTNPKSVIPSGQVTDDNGVVKCFFNQTVFTGALYLNAQRTYSANGSSLTTTNSTTNGQAAFAAWPYAAEVAQISPSGSLPTCYQFTDGALGAQVTDFSTALTAGDSECVCDYRSY